MKNADRDAERFEGDEPPRRPCLMVASVSDGAKRRQWLPLPRLLAPQLALPGHVLAKMRGFNGGVLEEFPVVAVWHGVYRCVLCWVSQLPFKSARKEKQSIARKTHGRKPVWREAEIVYDKAQAYERAMDIQSAIACLERACYLQPNNLTYRARLSKQWSDLSFAPGVDNERARELNRTAVAIAEKILLKDPRNVFGNIGLCVGKGRLAYFSDSRTKVHLAREAEEVARKAVVMHPKNDLLHHLLGRWHYEMAGLNVFARAVVRIVYGASLPPGTYAGALTEFEEAARLAPTRLIHFVQVGKAHWKLGNREQAIEALERAMELEVTEINDFLEAQEAARLLKRIHGVRLVPAWDFRLSKLTPTRPLFCEE
eukprot:evm.model.scf_636EXC.2 EVM.evm.TU.scf_636EXC.2   scf_636EXC:7783-11924(-)